MKKYRWTVKQHGDDLYVYRLVNRPGSIFDGYTNICERVELRLFDSYADAVRRAKRRAIEKIRQRGRKRRWLASLTKVVE